MADNDNQQASLAARGLRVFPLRPNSKLPVPDLSWPAFASDDVDRTTRRFANRFSGHNTAIATGNGLLVLDFDCKDDRPGLRSLDLLDMQGLPTSLRAITPSGGVHVYLSVPQDCHIPNSAERMRKDGTRHPVIPGYPGLDIRCDGGYVAAPPSVTAEGEYRFIDETAEIAPAPDWLIDLINEHAPRTRERTDDAASPATDLDAPASIGRAIAYLKGQAPEAVEGAGGDQTTYEVAARVKDFGISESQAFDLIAEHWNEAGKAIPPWDADDLQRKVSNAYLYGTARPGQIAGLAEFEPVPIYEPVMQTVLSSLDMEWIDAFDPALIPKRAWVLGKFLARGYLTGLVAPPGAGKTTLELMMAVSLASGVDILGMEVRQRTRVFVWNQEDELDELKRRLAAILKAFNLTFDDITIDDRPAILLGSGAENALMLARRGPNAKIVATKEADALTAEVIRHGIVAAFFDPFVELHPADENSNVEIGAVGRVFRSIAVTAQCAVMLVHHTRKPPAGESTGHAGNMDSARGAGSLVGVTRMGATLYGVDERTAATFGIREEDRHRYVRLDDGKNNMALASGEPVFFRRESVNIGTMEDPEEIGVLKKVDLAKARSKADRARDALAADIRAAVGEGAAAPADIARRLIASDPITYSDASPDSLARVIRRHLAEGNLSGIEWCEAERDGAKGRPARLIRQVVSDISDKEVENAVHKSKDEELQ